MPSRLKKLLSPIPIILNDEKNISELTRQVILYLNNINNKEKKSNLKGFSHLPECQYENVVDQCTKYLEEFFKRQGKEHRIEYISMLNYLMENFPFGLICVLKIKDTISNQLITIAQELWSDIK
ncbi:unnamed protein product [Rotaria sp. Silwood2]|nr:unnamed protein product [Rotaria sp. Silwood2]